VIERVRKWRLKHPSLTIDPSKGRRELFGPNIEETSIVEEVLKNKARSGEIVS